MKRTEYLLNLYHFGDESVKDEHSKLIYALRELLPDAQCDAEPVKSDFWRLTILIETP